MGGTAVSFVKPHTPDPGFRLWSRTVKTSIFSRLPTTPVQLSIRLHEAYHPKQHKQHKQCSCLFARGLPPTLLRPTAPNTPPTSPPPHNQPTTTNCPKHSKPPHLKDSSRCVEEARCVSGAVPGTPRPGLSTREPKVLFQGHSLGSAFSKHVALSVPGIKQPVSVTLRHTFPSIIPVSSSLFWILPGQQAILAA